MAKQKFIKRIIASPLVQTFLIYVSGGWIVLELTDYIINKYSLNEKISDVLPIILLIGLPVAIVLAWYLSRDFDVIEEPISQITIKKKPGIKLRILWEKPWFSIPGIIILILLIGTGIRHLHRQSQIRWANEIAIPEMQILLVEYDWLKAFDLLQKAKKYIPNDSTILRLGSRIAKPITVITEPKGAEVYYQPYSDVNGEWIFLGTTPLIEIKLPRYTLYRWRFEKEGYEVAYAGNGYRFDTLYRTLHEKGTIPEGMVYVEGIYNQTTRDYLSGNKNGFFIDKYEVTNRQFKKFLDQGGYQNPEYWQNEFVLNSDTLTFDTAMEFFKDKTGRSGPATWEAGDYPDGHEDYPVNGVSWFEAAAYAQFTGKELPTLWHWWSAAGNIPWGNMGIFAFSLVQYNNMGSSGPEPVGNHAGINCYGTFDMAGNVREWCWNRTPTERLILGGAWNDAIYMSASLSQAPPFDRSTKNGFRCVNYLDRNNIPDSAFYPGPFWGLQRDYRLEDPVTDLEYQIYKKQFLYDKLELNSLVEEKDTTYSDWIIEKVTFDAAYENERMVAYLFLPRESVPPYQTIIHFPGASALHLNSMFDDMRTQWTLDYIVKNGRALLFPIYKGTYERKTSSCRTRIPSQSHKYTECLVKWVKDFSRSIDYLETREDIDNTRLGYLGDSWGGRMGAIIPAIEDRLKLAVLIRAGFPTGISFPEADVINYAPHVELPILMLNGKYDAIYPYDYSVKPMFDMFGTDEKDKVQMLYNTDHFIPKNEMIKEVLNWLDKYFGPVRKASHSY